MDYNGHGQRWLRRIQEHLKIIDANKHAIIESTTKQIQINNIFQEYRKNNKQYKPTTKN